MLGSRIPILLRTLLSQQLREEEGNQGEDKHVPSSILHVRHGTSLAVQWLRRCNTEGASLIPGRETKILQARHH